MRILHLIALTRSVAVLALVLLALSVFAWIYTRTGPPGEVVPSASVSDEVKAPAPLLPKPDAVQVAQRVDTSAVRLEAVRVRSAERYAATVTVQAKHETVALGIRRVDPGWFSEFRLRRADPVAVDLLPGYEAEVLTIRQRLPLVDVELAPQIGLGLSREGIVGIVALTALRVSGVHLGGFIGAGRRHVAAGGYASIRPRPGFSLGIGLDAIQQTPMFAVTLNL